MKVVVASAFEASSLKAHAINTVKIAEGFAKLGHQVHLLCLAPRTGPVQIPQLEAHYGISAPMVWHQLPSAVLGLKITPHWPFFLLALPLMLRLSPDLVYSRNYILPAMTSRLGVPTIGETHAWPDNRTPQFRAFVRATHHRAFRRCVTISHRLAEQYAQLGADSAKLMVLPDAVDLDMFMRPDVLPAEASPYAGNGPHVVYAGHLYDYKGIPTILQAAALLSDVHFHLVGGLPADIQRHRQTVDALGLQNVTLHGLKPYGEVPPYLWYADALLLPPSAEHPSAAWTSPVKLGEYLASGVPVIATRIPALLDWLSEEEACFVAPDQPAAMADAIRRLLTDASLAARFSAAGRQKAKDLTYEGRVARMLADWPGKAAS